MELTRAGGALASSLPSRVRTVDTGHPGVESERTTGPLQLGESDTTRSDADRARHGPAGESPPCRQNRRARPGADSRAAPAGDQKPWVDRANASAGVGAVERPGPGGDGRHRTPSP